MNGAVLGGLRQPHPTTKLRDGENRICRVSEWGAAEVLTLLEMFSDPGDVVYDGSAGTLALAKATLRLGRVLFANDPDKATLDAGLARAKQAYRYYKSIGVLPALDDDPVEIPPALEKERVHPDFMDALLLGNEKG